MTDADSLRADGFVRVEGAFSREPAADRRESLRSEPRFMARPPPAPAGPLPGSSPVRIAIDRGPGR